MLFDIHLSSPAASRAALIAWIKGAKLANPNFTVVDVGGTAAGWTHEIADAIVDINCSGTDNYFKANINRYRDWDAVRDYVAQHGKFSFAICSHTLEDIANPMMVMDILPQIADEGFIAIPSKYREFAKFEGPYRGYIHHRWIFDFRNNHFVGYPKLGFLEYFTELHKIGNMDENVSELNFRWRKELEYRIVNDDYMGPTADAVCQYYTALL